MQLLEQIKSFQFSAPLPETLLLVEQRFDTACIDDVAGAVGEALARAELLSPMKPGASVAVGVGSRGINHLPVIVKTVIDRLQAAGMKPFIVPAMGSHGGATVEGQVAMLNGLGITPDSLGVEIRATMAVKQIGQIPGGPPLYQDLHSAAADHTLLINRVKPHTSFRGRLESGLTKMEVIGLGKQAGAELMHNLGVPAFQNYLAPAARIYETATNVVGGIAVVENGYDETAEIVGLTAAEIGTEIEEAMLVRAKALMPSLPFPEIEILAIRQMGKNISGTGMDPNIIGRQFVPRQTEDLGGPDIALIALFSLTEATHGNANGIGLANVISARVAREIDFHATYTNALTAGILGMQRTSLPLTMPTDLATLQIVLRNCAYPPDEARLVFIRDTLSLDQLWISANLRPAVEAHPRLTVIEEVPLTFDAAGRMTSPWQLA